jgi:hypothetical protein
MIPLGRLSASPPFFELLPALEHAIQAAIGAAARYSHCAQLPRLPLSSLRSVTPVAYLKNASLKKFIGCFIYLWQSEVNRTSEFVSLLMSACTQIPSKTFDTRWNEHSHLLFQPSWLAAGVFAGLAAAPIPMAWLLVWIVYRVGRWVRGER